jgi:hypothetical protein
MCLWRAPPACRVQGLLRADQAIEFLGDFRQVLLRPELKSHEIIDVLALGLFDVRHDNLRFSELFDRALHLLVVHASSHYDNVFANKGTKV